MPVFWKEEQFVSGRETGYPADGGSRREMKKTGSSLLLPVWR
jgi:hypothetical protein